MIQQIRDGEPLFRIPAKTALEFQLKLKSEISFVNSFDKSGECRSSDDSLRLPSMTTFRLDYTVDYEF